MRFYESTLLISACLLVAASCNQTQGPEAVDNYKGLVINEVSVHEETADAESWVEIYNSGSEAVKLDGVGLFVTDEYFNGREIASPTGVLEPGARLVLSTVDESLYTGVSSDAPFELRLGTKEIATDTFVRDDITPEALTERGSWQRIPDGGQEWKKLPYASPDRPNEVFDVDATKPTAIWAWSSHIASMSADNYASLKNLYSLGYRHILLNYAAFHPNSKRKTIEFMRVAEDMGWTIHAWLQCFYNGGWENPIDDANNKYKEEVFERIRNNARRYIEEFGVKGLHLDYIRFGGTAYKHNPSAEVNAVGAVNRCCREIREVADSFGAGIVTSAALMPEPSSTQYYGQSPALMGQYIHILMPMIYRYSYHLSDASCKSVANWFADNSGGAKMWSGIQTYMGNDSSVTPMDADALRKDINIFMDTRGTGIVLFRYGLGTFPDVNDLN
ncbi:MAG: hypothetical protein J6O51_00080 [Bacteroidales bacterium]|nr:hypothetical protein [Bacteroidales bacterium]